VNSTSRLIRFSVNCLVYSFVTTLVIAAILLSLARILLPNIDEYKPTIEGWVSELIGQQIEIATLDAAWYGVEPQLVLKGVQLLSADRKETYGYFQQARLGVNLFGSIAEGRVLPGAFTVEGARFVAIRQRDGSISIEGISNSGAGGDENSFLEEWFFEQRLLDVKDSELVWLDLTRSEKTWLFTDVNLRFRNEGDRHVVNGSVTLPEELGATMAVSMDAKGDLLSAKGWSGNAYIEGANLKMAEWSRDFELANVSITEGVSGVKLWSQWRRAELISVRGEAIVNNFQVVAKGAPKIRVIDSFSANIAAQKQVANWEVTLDKVQVSSNRRKWPQSRLDVLYNPMKQNLLAEVSYLDLSEVLPVVGFLEHKNVELNDALANLKIKGVLSNFTIAMKNLQQTPDFHIKANYSSLSTKAWEYVPGVTSIDGRFELNNEFARIDVPKQSINLNYPSVFSGRKKLRDLQAGVYVDYGSGQFSLVARDINLLFRDTAVNGSLKYTHADNVEPLLDLALYTKGGLVSDVKHYLPKKLLSDDAVEWIEAALLDGEVKNGGLLFYGNVTDYPFVENQGLFDIDLTISEGQLFFTEGWPEIDNIEGQLNLHANGLEFVAKSATTLDSQLNDVAVSLPSFSDENLLLKIVGSSVGSTEEKLHYLHTSPLQQIFAEDLDPLLATGSSELSLDLTIPLSFPEQSIAKGLLIAKDNKVFSKEWMLDFENVDLALNFENEKIWSEKVTANYKDIAVEGKIVAIEKNNITDIVIQAEAVLEKENIDPLLVAHGVSEVASEYLEGKTRIKSKVLIPGADPAVEDSVSRSIKLSFESDLDGLGVKLPYPLGKTQEEIKPLFIGVDLTGITRQLRVHLGDVHSVFEFAANEKNVQWRRGNIGFEEVAQLPAELGFRFSGKLREFDWSSWSAVIDTFGNGEKQEPSAGASIESLFFDLSIGKLLLFGNEFKEVTVQASQTAQLWSIHLSGPELEGQIFIPVVLSSAPLILNMERLYVRPAGESEGSTYIDPNKMPELKIDIGDFRFNEIAYGKFFMRASKIENGLRLTQFSAQSPFTKISGKGDWTESANGQSSKFDLSIETNNVGKELQNWGFANAIGGGKGKILVNAKWPNNPSDFSFRTASGDISVSLQDASLLDFDLGATKMFGLLLPRRLLLDFRDVFKKGLSFDGIEGDYQLDSGDVFTSGLHLTGPVADIHVAGRIGLVKNDYDQVVTVNRRLVSDSLPLLAALAANPILAAQVFVFKKMFENQIADILSIQYVITGPWEKPVITPVIKNYATGEDLSEDFLEGG